MDCTGLLGEWNHRMSVKHLEECLAQGNGVRVCYSCASSWPFLLLKVWGRKHEGGRETVPCSQAGV